MPRTQKNRQDCWWRCVRLWFRASKPGRRYPDDTSMIAEPITICQAVIHSYLLPHHGAFLTAADAAYLRS